MFLVIAASIVIAPSLLANLYDPTNVINQSKAIGSLLPDGARAKTRGRLMCAAHSDSGLDLAEGTERPPPPISAHMGGLVGGRGVAVELLLPEFGEGFEVPSDVIGGTLGLIKEINDFDCESSLP